MSTSLHAKGPRDDLFAAMPPLEAKKTLFAFAAGVRGKRREQGREEVKPMVSDVKKAQFNAKCDEEEWVELPDELEKFGEVFQAEEIDHPQTHVRVVVHCDDFTLAATEWASRKMRSWMCELYGVKVSGILGSGKRDVCEIEMSARSLRWTEEGVEHDASDKQRRTLLKKHGIERVVEDRRQLGSKAKGKRARRGRTHAGRSGEGEVQELGRDAERRESGQIGRAVRREGDMHEDGQPDRRELGETEEGMQTSERSARSDVAMRTRRHDEMKVDVHVDSDWTNGPERKSTSGGMMIIDGTVVRHWSRTQASRALITADAVCDAVMVSECGQRRRFGD